MKKIIVLLFFISAMCGFTFAQSSFPELEIAKEIKLLRSTHQDVIKIMTEFDRDEDDDEDEYQEFRSDRAKINVSFSSGDCSEDSAYYNLPAWNVPEQTATKVLISFDETTKLKDLGVNLSKFKKRLQDEDEKDSEEFIYYDEIAGIMILTDEGEVEKIILHPPKRQTGFLCVNEDNEELLSGETSFIDSVKQIAPVCSNYPPNVTNLDLKANGVFGCKDENCANAKKEIAVKTTATDPENDVVTYEYTISGGNIVGSGVNVVWDLTNVKPGIYTITAGVNDGCGICGETKGQKILVGENSFQPIAPAKIKELILDKTELIAACPVGRLKRIQCPSGNCGVSVSTVAVSPDGGGNFTYKYEVSGGNIVENGDHAVWDLAKLTPGEYSITVWASDIGGIFGSPETATVEIKENTYCFVPKNR